MKVKFWDRLLLSVYALIGIIGSLALCALLYYRNRISLQVMGYHISLQDNAVTICVLIALALLLLLWSIKILTLAFRHEPKVDKSSVSVQNTENGSVRVSVQAMDMLVKQAIGNTEGVVDIKTHIINHEDSITVKIEMTLESDVHIPNVTMLMQRSIKNFIEEFSGIAVREVTILVSKIIEVTPQPPLAIQEPQKQPEIIDQPDAIEPELTPEAASAAPNGVEDEEPVVEYEADHTQSGADEEQPAPPPESEIESDADPDAEVSTQDTGNGQDEQNSTDEDITEKDFW